jgi:transposase
MINLPTKYSTPKQAVLPMLIQDYLDICDPVLTFERFMDEINLEKYLESIPRHYTGRLRYNPVSMLKTVLFGFMMNGYISLRELDDNCKVNLRFMHLMDHETPSYRTFGYFINEVLSEKIEDIFADIRRKRKEDDRERKHRDQEAEEQIDSLFADIRRKRREKDEAKAKAKAEAEAKAKAEAEA